MDQQIPAFLLKSLLFKCQVNSSHDTHCLLVLSPGPFLHEVRHLEIIRTCDLTTAIISSNTARTKDDGSTDKIHIDQYFGYTATTRIPYYFIQMHPNHLVIVNAAADAALSVSSMDRLFFLNNTFITAPRLRLPPISRI